MANSQQQPPTQYAQRNTTTALATIDFNEKGLVVGSKAQNVLNGLFPAREDQTRILAMAVACGMAPDNLALPKNIATLQKAYTLVKDLGMQPGIHFVMMPFEDRGTGLKEYALVVTVDYLATNVENWCAVQSARMRRSIYVQLQTRVPKKADEIKEALEFYGPEGIIESPLNRVAFARYVRIIDGRPEMGPDEGWDGCANMGYYLHVGVRRIKKDGSGTYITASDAGKTAGNVPGRAAINVAVTRAQRMAAREITNRQMLPVDNRTVEEREAVFIDLVRQQPYDVRQSAGLLTDGDALFEREDDVNPRNFFVEKEIQYEEDGDVLWAAPDKRKPAATKSVTTVTPEPVQASAPEPVAADEPEDANFGEVAEENRTWQELSATVWKQLPDEHKRALAELEGACKQESPEVTPAALTKLEQRIAEACGCATGDVIDGHKVVTIIWCAIAGTPVVTKEGLDTFAKLTGGGNPWRMSAKSPVRSALEAAYGILATLDGDGF